MNKENYINIFAELGNRLSLFDEHSDGEIVAMAMSDNQWFMSAEIVRSLHNIAHDMLAREVLERWLLSYDIDYNTQRRIAIIMAGNIPAVGFADLMCVLVSGHQAHIKPSSKDSVLMGYIVSQLKQIEPSLPIYEYSADDIYDAVIATGSDNTGKYFQSKFSGLPSLIRGSRGSVAVLNGSESDDQLRGLGEDIFSYSGLGCRNVSLVFTPEWYSIERLGSLVARSVADINKKYYNNYRALKAKLTASGDEFVDCGYFIITHGNTFPIALSNIVVCSYSDIMEVDEWVEINDASLQCVVSSFYNHPRVVDFSKAQHPKPCDYADGVDVVDFLKGI